MSDRMVTPKPGREGFDRPDKASPFLRFVAGEFRRRGTPRRLELSKKIHSHPFVASKGMRVPRHIGVLDSIEDLSRMDLPERFVLKYAKGWSARGVMLLERQRGELYFDHLSLRHRALDEIVTEQKRVAASFGGAVPEWLVEEFIEPTLAVGAVPFDYKFYCFNGVVGMVGQFDRNANPPRMALFDGQFRPLRHGRDYLRTSPRVQRGVPLVPLHAPEMLRWAQSLSREVDAPFVSVDMYDSVQGPVFGEFTYSPGGTHKRMFTFAHHMIDRFDQMMNGAAAPDPLGTLELSELQRIARPDPSTYSTLASYAYNNGPRGAMRLAEFFSANQGGAAGAKKRAWSDRMAHGWTQIGRSILEQQKSQWPALRPNP